MLDICWICWYGACDMAVQLLSIGVLRWLKTNLVKYRSFLFPREEICNYFRLKGDSPVTEYTSGGL